MISRLVCRCGLLCVLVLGGASAALATPLDDYVNAPDPVYGWELMATYDREGYTDYIVHLTSQRWLTLAEVDRTLWEHWLIITKPDNVAHNTGFLLIGSGRNTPDAPVSNDPLLVKLAQDTQSVTAYLRQVPNQPLTFTGYRSETEDGLIAYGWKQYFLTGDPKWLMRLPMTKSAVRAMDAITDMMFSPEGGGEVIEDFVVAGASKRGWTTWTTAAVDPRVVGCVPMVIDLLSMENSFRHHWDVYGFWSPAINDYVENDIMDWFGTPQMRGLIDIVEPFSYRHRLTMPKFIVNASGDEFFLPDSSQFYFDRLEGEKHLFYVANSSHGGLEEPFANAMTGWYWSLLNDAPRPEVTWYKRADGSLVIDTHGTAPMQALLWKATNPSARMFVQEVLGDLYSSTPLAPVSPSTPTQFVAAVPPPAQGWTAFYVEFRFNNIGPVPFVCTTEVSVVPDVLPYGPQYSQGPAEALLDDTFFTEGGTAPVPVRDAVGGVASNDGKRVAFWGVHKQTQTAGLFVVNVGRTSSWRRLANDLPSKPANPIVWLPDDSGIVVGQTLLAVPPPGQRSQFNPYILHGRPADIRGMTAKASGNWAIALVQGEVLALPILPNGTEDFSRQPVFATDLKGLGINIVDLAVAADGSTLAFSDSRPVTGKADFGDVYTVRNLPAILAAAKRPDTDISTLAPAALGDDNLFAVRTVETDNFAGFPMLSDDGSLALFAEDWANVFRRDGSQTGTSFDVMVSYGDGTEADARLSAPGTYAHPVATRGGLRVVFTQPATSSTPATVMAAPLRTATRASDFDPNIFFKRSLATVARQQFESDGSAMVDVDNGVTINIPEGELIWIETPLAPVQHSKIPAAAGALPVVRRIGPEATTFTKPGGNADAVLLTIDYTDAEIQGLDENGLRVYRQDAGDGVFRELEANRITLDKANNRITARIDGLGTYAVGGPGSQDDDGDGMSNRYEGDHGLDPYSANDFDDDPDGDGLNNLVESQIGSSPTSEDSDNDGSWDGVEHRAGSDPASAQSVPPLPIRGDVDWTGSTNALDVQLVINGALGKKTSCNTDINGDHTTNAFDVQVVINWALGGATL